MLLNILNQNVLNIVITARRHRLTRAVALFVMTASFLLCGCARLAPPTRVADNTWAPEAFSLYDHAPPAPEHWWLLFESEELNHLVAQALADNLSLQQVYARLTQAEMLARQAGAPLLPDLEFSGDASATRRQRTVDSPVSTLDRVSQQLSAAGTLLNPTVQGGDDSLSSTLRSAQARVRAAETLLEEPPPSRVAGTTRSYGFGLASGYEVDLWGRVRARHQAALLDYEASKEDLYAAMLSLSGTVARQWLTLAAQQQEYDLVLGQLALNKQTRDLIELRFRNGLANALDVYQQRQIVAQTESLLPTLEENLQATRYELAVLLGQPPRTELGIVADTLPEVGPLPEPGLPADLLARRPDIRAAGLALQAADWRVSAARADRLPALRLSASAGFDADDINVLFDNWMARLAGSLTGPIFDAGRRKAEVERTRAVAEERLLAYRNKILDSVKEVEGAMLREYKQSAYVEALKHERDTAQAAHDQALDRYMKGISDYLPVLSALTQLQALERRLVQAEHRRLEHRIQLCVALGGAWMMQEHASAAEAAE